MSHEMTDEEYVRSKWEAVQAQYINCGMGSSYWVVLSGDRELSRTYCGALDGGRAAWTAAAEFTRQREEEIRQVVFEISLLKLVHSRWDDPDDRLPDWEADQLAIGRVLSREQAALAELKRGMK